MNFIDASHAPLKNTGQIKIHNEADFEGMRTVGRMAAQTLDLLGEFVTPGVTTQFLDDKAVEIVRDLGAVPAPLNIAALPNPFAPRLTMWCATAFRATKFCAKAIL